MLTLLFWVVIFGVNRAEFNDEQAVLESEAKQAVNTNKTKSGPAKTSNAPVQNDQVRNKQRRERNLKRMNDGLAGYKTWQNRLELILAVLPKTKQTTDLVEYWTVESGEGFVSVLSGAGREQQRGNNVGLRIQKRLDEHYRDVSPWYVIGTSLAFEMAVLGFACFLFVRRDF
jgi:hypothetical protein